MATQPSIFSRFLGEIKYWVSKGSSTAQDYVARDLLLVDCGEGEGVAGESWLRAALAFLPGHIEVRILEGQERPPRRGVAEISTFLREHAPRHYLFINSEPSGDLLAALKLHQISFASLHDPAPPGEISEFSDKSSGREKLRELIGRRYTIYAHASKRTKLAELSAFFEGCREARLDFPDLLILMTGAKREQIAREWPGLFIAGARDMRARRNAADLILLEGDEPDADCISVCNVTVILSSNTSVEYYGRTVLERGSALVLYGVDARRQGVLGELDATGAIWSVQRGGLLGAALAQALLPEKSALTAVQSLERLTESALELDQIVDTLLSQRAERAESA